LLLRSLGPEIDAVDIAVIEPERLLMNVIGLSSGLSFRSGQARVISLPVGPTIGQMIGLKPESKM